MMRSCYFEISSLEDPSGRSSTFQNSHDHDKDNNGALGEALRNVSKGVCDDVMRKREGARRLCYSQIEYKRVVSG